MTSLTTVEAVRRRGALRDVEDVNIKVYEALQLTTARLSEALRTDFDVVTTYDEFFVSRYKLNIQPRRIKLLMKHGFIDSTATPTIKIASDINDVSGQVALETANLRWDYERGVVTIVGSDQVETILNRFDIFGDLYARAEYTCGFNTSDEDAIGVDAGLVYDQTEVPAWLIEAATQWGVVTYDWLVSDKRDSRSINAAPEFKDRIETALIASKMRYVPTAVRALN